MQVFHETGRGSSIGLLPTAFHVYSQEAASEAEEPGFEPTLRWPAGVLDG